MSYKIAVASSDGKVVNQHFGKATKFLLFQVEDKQYKFLEVIDTNPFCSSGEHDDNQLLKAAEGLIGCRAVLVSQIGNGAVQILRSKGIDAFDTHGFIENVIEKLIKYYYRIDGGKENGKKD